MAIPAGVIAPLVTPLRPDWSVDKRSLCRLIDYVSGAGCAGVLVLGSTGEHGALSRSERFEVLRTTIEHVGDRTHVMAGLPALGLKDAAADAAEMARVGASSLLVPAPYGMGHSSSEIAEYFVALRAVTGDTPIVAYNVPSRSGVVLEEGLVRKLAEAEVIAGVKDSSGNIEAHRLVTRETAHVSGFCRFTGSERCIDAALLGGFTGAIPGLANVAPRLAWTLVERAESGDWAGAARVQAELIALSDLYSAPSADGSFTGTAIGALKCALVQLGVIEHATVSHPFRQPDQRTFAHVELVLRTLRMIS